MTYYRAMILTSNVTEAEWLEHLAVARELWKSSGLEAKRRFASLEPHEVGIVVAEEIERRIRAADAGAVQ